MGVDSQLLDLLARWRGRARSAPAGRGAVILGIGNPLKGDDAVGPLVCERLAGNVPATVIDGGNVPENHIGPVLRAAPDVLFIVDALDFGGRPGQIRVSTLDELEGFAFSTHALSLHLALDLIRREKAIDVCVIGVQAGRTQLGDGLSAAVGEAVGTLADTLTQFFRSGQ